MLSKSWIDDPPMTLPVLSVKGDNIGPETVEYFVQRSRLEPRLVVRLYLDGDDGIVDDDLIFTRRYNRKNIAKAPVRTVALVLCPRMITESDDVAKSGHVAESSEMGVYYVPKVILPREGDQDDGNSQLSRLQVIGDQAVSASCHES